MNTTSRPAHRTNILRIFLPALVIAFFRTRGAGTPKNSDLKQDSAVFVNPFIGVLDDESNCVIGPQVPFGSLNPSPQTPLGSHDGYSPHEAIRGFGQLRVSGTGWGKYGQIFVSAPDRAASRRKGARLAKSKRDRKSVRIPGVAHALQHQSRVYTFTSHGDLSLHISKIRFGKSADRYHAQHSYGHCDRNRGNGVRRRSGD